MSGERNQNSALVKAQSARSLYQRVRIPLDAGLRRGRSPESVFDMPFMGLWVYDVSSPTVQVSVRFNSRHDTGAELPLKKNMVINHEQQVINCAFTAPPQAGQWIELIFAIESRLNIGNIEQQVVGEVGLTPKALNDISGPRIKFGSYDVPDNGEFVHLRTRAGLGGSSFASIPQGQLNYDYTYCLNNPDLNEDNQTMAEQARVFKVPAGFEFEALSFKMTVDKAQDTDVLTYMILAFVGGIDPAKPYTGMEAIGYPPEIESFVVPYGANIILTNYIQAPQLSSFYFDGAFGTWAIGSSMAGTNGPAIIDEGLRVGFAIHNGDPNPLNALTQYEILGRLRPKL